MTPVLKLENIGYSYHSIEGEIPALSQIDFTLNYGEFISIIGPSGCGKSTLLSLIARLLEPECGTISFYQPDGTLSSPSVGYMLQKDQLLEWRSIYKNVILGLEIKRQLTARNLARVDDMLKKYGLHAFRNKKPHELSGGMRQRAALIRTLALDPEILLLDEPFSALDYQTRLSVSDDIYQIIRSEGKSALLVTHDLAEAISLGDRVLVLSKRPATIACEVPISLHITAKTPFSARSSPDFKDYFNRLWKELPHES